MRPHSILLLLLLVVPPSLLRAEESEPFYEKDYARSPSREGRGGTSDLSQPADMPAATSAPVEATTTDNSIEGRVKALARGAKESAQSGNATALQNRKNSEVPASQMKVEVIGAVFDGTSETKLAEHIQEMLNALSKTPMLISTIYAVGPHHNLPLPIQYEVTKRQGRILFVKELPEKYAMIKESPSWILSSLSQEIILEGAGPLSENFAPNGKIISTAQRIPAPAKATP